MRDRPDGPELLSLARQALRELADELRGEQRYTALLVGNAMAMALRELEAGAGPGSDPAALRTLLEGRTEKGDPVADLAKALREGRLDGSAAAHEWLQAEVVERLKISNPNMLKDDY